MRWWRLEPRPGETLRKALERTVRDAILSGTLRAGARLPASRRLAQDLGVSRGVVTDAYTELVAQGYLLSRGRAAPVVATVAAPRTFSSPAESSAPRIRYDLTATTPDVNLFPVRRWLASAFSAGQGVTAATLDYRDPGGERGLREALADHLGRTRGVIAQPEQIVVTQGTSQGVDLFMRVLHGRGLTRVAVEDPSHTGQQVRIRSAGLTLVAQTTDENGLRVDHLSANAVLITPAHQFPTGTVLSEPRRQRLLSWARRTNAVVIEDDYDAEFRYDREPVRALQGLAPECVVQLGTVSKTLVPALRIGWMVVPLEFLEDVLHYKAVADEGSPTLDQISLSAYLRSGDYDRQIRKARAVYRARRDRLVDELAEAFPEFPLTGIAAGLHVLLRLPAWIDDAAIAESALQSEIRVAPLSHFCVERTDAKGLVIGYGRLDQSAVAHAVSQLEPIVRRFLDEAPDDPGPEITRAPRIGTTA